MVPGISFFGAGTRPEGGRAHMLKNKRHQGLRNRIRAASALWPILFAVSLVVFLGGRIGPATAAGAQPISVTDFREKTVSLSAPAARIVCLIESALSGIYMLGAEEQVIGISTNVYQEAVFGYYAAMDRRIRTRALPTPGSWDFVNIEMVVGLRPDLVIVWSHQEESILALEEKGIPVYGVFIQRLDDIYKELHDLGRLTGTAERADQVIGFAKDRVSGIRNRIVRVPDEQRTRVYYMWAQGELETSGENSTVEELIRLAGGRNVAGHISQEHLVINIENILTWNPQVIVMWYNERKSPEDIMAKAMWRSVRAVKDRRVHEFPDVFSCDLWTLKYIHAIELVARWCYPDRFKTPVSPAQKWELLENLYGTRLNQTAFDKVRSGK